MLNGEGIFDIFSWLSAKDLCKYSLVCKSANELLSEEYFIKKQFRNMQMRNDTGFLLHYGLGGVEFHALCAEEGPLVPSSSLKFLQNITSGQLSIVGSSNGLLCLRSGYNERSPFYIFNPATKTTTKIHVPDYLEGVDLSNVVFDCSNGDEELLIVIKHRCSWDEDDILSTSVFYSTKEQVWKEGHKFYLGERDIIFENSVYQNGVVYMISDWWPGGNDWPYIVAYDTKTGVAEFLKIPKGARKGLKNQPNQKCKLKIFKYGSSRNSFKSIVFVKYYKKVFTMWLLVDPEKLGTWSRVFKMRAKAMGLVQQEDELDVAGFTLANDNILLVATQDKVYSYNLEEYCCKELCKHKCKGTVEHQYVYGDCVRIHPYISTLRPCGTKLSISSTQPLDFEETLRSCRNFAEEDIINQLSSY